MVKVVPLRFITYDPLKDPSKMVYRRPISKPVRAFKGFFSEFIGTLYLVFFCGGSVCSALAVAGDSAARALLACFIQGMALAALIWAVSGVSGCNLNPAVTLANLLSGRVGLIDSISYVAAQVVGCIAGAGILYGCLPAVYRIDLGVPHLAPGMNTGEGFLLEMMLTCILCLTVLGTSVFNVWDRRMNRVAPFAIGLALLIGVGIGFNFTGGALNPVRVLGPSIISGVWSNHWIYWLGPIVGAIMAAFIYRCLLQERFDVIERPGYIEPLIDPTAASSFY
ncbi:aquaporin [Dictyostelium purpureum]|uniref:Aquaporin n=1 Tax=Dictyostelium purpureum TaxID=5786 RepID=F0Z8Z5_DICPU|nr:aquaporin [Dictyostelium purpureum]EGC39546.1 aquaporin [Dictyostelium purpureum]|eukprot:XP_003283881.1 aquaporin [Dictyostelium purpureum]